MKKKTIAITAASVLGALGLAFAVTWAVTPNGSGIKDVFAERVSEEDRAESLARAEEAQKGIVTPGQADRVVTHQMRVEEVEMTGSPIVDTTDDLLEDFGLSAEFMIQVSTGKTPESITMSKDDCLLGWAREALASFDGQGVVETREVCGRVAAVFAGGFGMGSRDLLNDVLTNGESDPAYDLIFGATALDFASVSTEDSKGVLTVVARPSA